MTPMSDELMHGSFRAMVAACSRLSELRPVEEVLDDLLSEARGLLGADAGTVYVVEQDRLRFVCCQNESRPDLVVAPEVPIWPSAALLRGRTLPLDTTSLAGYVGQSGRTLRIDDARAISQEAPYRFSIEHDESTGYRTRSLLVLPLAVQGMRPIGVLQLINKRGQKEESVPFGPDDEQIGLALASMASIVVRNAQLHAQVERSHLDTIFRLATAAEFRDADTGDHIRRVSMYSECIALELGHEPEWCRRLQFAVPMHDVGKLGIPDAILQKEGPLTEPERETMKQHTVIGARILAGSDVDVLQMAECIALTHHERWDGTGYPAGLAGTAIPVEGRIVAVADVFDALTSDRCYKQAYPVERGFEVVEQEAGRHFDPEVVQAFVRRRVTVEQICETFREL